MNITTGLPNALALAGIALGVFAALAAGLFIMFAISGENLDPRQLSGRRWLGIGVALAFFVVLFGILGFFTSTRWM